MKNINGFINVWTHNRKLTLKQQYLCFNDSNARKNIKIKTLGEVKAINKNNSLVKSVCSY